MLKPDLTVAMMMVYPYSVGRNMDELLRVLDSLLLADAHPAVATPSGWRPGDDVVVSHDLSDDDARKEFGSDGFRVVDVPSERGQEGLKKHYLRLAKQPRRIDKVIDRDGHDGRGCLIS